MCQSLLSTSDTEYSCPATSYQQLYKRGTKQPIHFTSPIQWWQNYFDSDRILVLLNHNDTTVIDIHRVCFYKTLNGSYNLFVLVVQIHQVSKQIYTTVYRQLHECFTDYKHLYPSKINLCLICTFCSVKSN